MTTKIITPQEVTTEMLVAGVESNETATNLPSRFQLVNGDIQYSVLFKSTTWTGGLWERISTITFEEIQKYMVADSGANTIWTTTVEQETA